MTFLMRLRPSNLIILFALPFIVWLFATAPDYGRSLTAIVGVEKGAGVLVPGFVLCLLAALAGLLAAHWAGQRRGLAASACSLLAILILLATDLAMPFLASVLANAVDPFTSTLVVREEIPRRLTDVAQSDLSDRVGQGMVIWLCLSLMLMLMTLAKGRTLLWGRRALWALNAGIAAYLLLVAHLGFAAGVATSIRAAILAYALAILLGLSWVGLMQLHLHRRTPWIFCGLIAALALMAFWQFAQPKAEYVLLGTPEAKIGIVKGTPASLIGAIQYGAFPGAATDNVQIRSFATPEAALVGLSDGSGVSAVFIPRATMPVGMSPFWQSEALGDANRTAWMAAAVVAIILGLLLLGGTAHHRHPLSVGAEFIIDTIRGIPMLVIVLYIGLPLAGAVKDASGGFIDPPNLLRGILAMALAYSAYLAEIFRSGINAVPTGQIEAARSLGLSRWATARHVILPQAFRIIIPPLGNEFIAILKDTSLLSILSIRDITQRMREFQSASFLPFAPYNSAAIFYVLLTLVAASLVASIERKYHVEKR